ncbi:conserved hypothetical protein [Clostridium botulinum D str. 1873]|nr:hypothetical protein [Clostridium botulinum]EES91432.1 conserved hypothetical protein [Clostridium botulinum D str. 1873]
MNINIKRENVKNLENNLLELGEYKFKNNSVNELINQIIKLNESILQDYKKFLYHKKRKKNKITDEKIEKAINMIEEHKISKKIIAQKYKISVPTLTKYINEKKVKNTVNFNQSEINNLTNNNNMKAEDLGENLGKDSAEDLGENLGKDSVENLGENLGKDSVENLGENLGKDSVENSAEDSAEDSLDIISNINIK